MTEHINPSRIQINERTLPGAKAITKRVVCILLVLSLLAGPNAVYAASLNDLVRNPASVRTRVTGNLKKVFKIKESYTRLSPEEQAPLDPEDGRLVKEGETYLPALPDLDYSKIMMAAAQAPAEALAGTFDKVTGALGGVLYEGSVHLEVAKSKTKAFAQEVQSRVGDKIASSASVVDRFLVNGSVADEPATSVIRDEMFTTLTPISLKPAVIPQFNPERVYELAQNQTAATQRTTKNVSVSGTHNVAAPVIAQNQTPPVPQINTAQPQVVTRVVERVVGNGISQDELNAQMDALANRLNARMTAMRASIDTVPGVAVERRFQTVYRAVAASNDIDQLNDVAISSAAISDSTFTNATISSGSFTGTTVTASGDVSGADGTFSGTITAGGQLVVSGTGTSTIAGDVNFDSNTLYIDSINNRVGVGTSSPSTLFTVAGDAYFDGTLTVTGITSTSSSAAPFFVANSATGTSTYAGGITVDTDKFVVDPDAGRVGIGTSSPGASLAIQDGDIYVVNGTAANAKIILEDQLGSVSEIAGGTFGAGGSSKLSFRTADAGVLSTKVVIADDGRVGIGTTTPSARLAIEGSASDTALYIAGYANGTGDLFTISTSTASATSTAFVVNSQGRVAIGTSSPSSNRGQLEIYSGNQTFADGNGQLALFSTDPYAIDKGGSLVFGGPRSDSDFVRTFAAIAGRKENATDSDRLGYLQFGTRGSSDIEERARITSGGFFGIGTTTPESKLTVAGDTDATFTISSAEGTAGNPTINLKADRAAAGSLVGNIQWINSDPSSPTAAIKAFRGTTDAAGELALSTSNTERLRIDEDGNVGIGTTSPWANLSVEQGAGEVGFAIGSSSGDSNFVVDASGFVGISSSTPNSVLSVDSDSGNTQNRPLVSFNVTGASATDLGEVLHLTSPRGVGVDDADLFLVGGSYGADTHFTVRNTGFVGINQGSPTYALEVTGMGRFTSLVDATHFIATSTTATSTFRGGVVVGDSASNSYGKLTVVQDADVDEGGIGFVDSGNAVSGRLYSSGSAAIFNAANGGTGTLVLNEGGGNVGIGTTTPSDSLVVHNGGIDIYDDADSIRSLQIWRNNIAIGSLHTSSNRITLSASNDNGAALYDNAQNGIFVRDGGNVSIGGDAGPDAELEIIDNGDAPLMISSADDADGDFLIVDSTGLVGIGTSSPQNLLHLDGPSDGSGYLRITDSVTGSTATDGLRIGLNAGSPRIHNYESGDLTFLMGSGGTEVVRFANGGSVGIGTSTPWANLSIEQDAGEVGFAIGSSTGTNFLVNEDGRVAIGTSDFHEREELKILSNNVSEDPNIVISQTSTGDAAIRFNISGVSNWTTGVDNGDGDKFKIANGPALSAANQFFTIDTSGNVGIGTNTPQSVLSVQGDGADLRISSATDNLADSGSIIFEEGLSGVGIELRYDGTNPDGGGGILEIHDITGSQIAAFSRTGNVGIGSTTPGYKLAVEGTGYFADGLTTGAITASSTITATADLIVGDELIFRNGGSAVQASVEVINSIAAGDLDIQTRGGTNFYIDTNENSTTESWDIYNGPNTSDPLLTVVQDGTVGINNASPTYALDVTGIGRFTGLVDATHFVATSTTATSTFAGGLTVNSIGFVVDPDAGRVGIGTTDPDGTLHARTGNAGSVTAEGEADDLVVENSTSGGLSILVPDASNSNIRFGSPTSNSGALVRWNYSGDEMTIGTNKSGAHLRFMSDAFSEAARFDSSGNLGIGTTTPANLLDVYGASPVLSIDASSGSPELQFTDGGTDEFSIIYNTGSNFLGFVEGGVGTHVVIADGGNVGIGTTSPQGLTHLTSAAGTDSALIVDTTTADAAGGDAFLSLREAGTEKWKIRSQGDGADRLKISSASVTNALTIAQTGGVGIGVQTGDGTLHVHTATAGSVTASTNADDLIVENSGRGGISILTPDANTSELYFGSPTNNSGALVEWNHDANFFRLGTNNVGGYVSVLSGAGNEAVRVISSGNVGIGSSTPGYKLAVEGTAYFADTVIMGGITATSTITAGNFVATDATATSTFAGGLTVDSTDFVVDPDAGRVGIGTDSPASDLDVRGLLTLGENNQAGLTQFLHVMSNSSSSRVNGLGLGSNNDELIIFADEDNAGSGSESIQFKVGGSERVRIDDSGNVGIGTTTPTNLLTIDGGDGGGAEVTPLRLVNTGTAVNDNVVIELKTAASQAAEIVAIAPGSGDTDLDFRVSNSNATAASLLYLDGDGNVGIGTTTPGAPLTLDMAGSVNTSFGTFDHALQINTQDNTTNNWLGIAFSSDTDSNFDAGIGVQYTDHTSGSEDTEIAFFTRDGGSFGERLRIDDAGNVGIGTDSPGAKLEVVADSGSSNIFRIEENAADGASALLVFDKGASASDGGRLFFGNGGGSTVMSFDARSGNPSYINNGGNFGIGTTSPWANLSIEHEAGEIPFAIGSSTGTHLYVNEDGFLVGGPGGSTGGYSLSPSGGSDFYAFTVNRSGSGLTQPDIWDTDGDGIVLGNDSSSADLVIDTDGDVGIGINAPDGTLHAFTATAGSVSAGTSGDDLVIENSANVGLTLLSPNTADASIFFGDPESNATGAIQYSHSENHLRFTTNGSQRIRINSSGLVGIGTTSPTEVLTVAASSGDSAYFEGQVGIGTNDPAAELQINAPVNPTLHIGSQSTTGTSTLKFQAGVDGAGNSFNIRYDKNNGQGIDRLVFVDGGLNTPLTLENGGNVGFDVTDPQRLVSVKGQDTTPWLSVERSSQTTEQLKFINAESSGYVTSRGTTLGSWANVIDSENSDFVITSRLGGSTGGNIILDVDTGVGIGTTTPVGTLTISAVAPSITFDDTGDASAWDILQDNGDLEFRDGYAGSSPTSRVYFQAGGKVGIGASPSEATLEVAGTSGEFLEIGTQNNDWGGNMALGATNGNGFIIGKNNTDNNTNRVMTFTRDDTNGGTITGYEADGTTVGFRIRGENTSYFSGGNVGIGEVTPDSLLHVNANTGAGNINIQGANATIPTTYASNDGAQIYHARDGSTGERFADIVANGASFSASSMRFFTQNSSDSNTTERMRIDSNGNVGIGTTSPDVKLRIEGTSSGESDGAEFVSLVASGSRDKLAMGVDSTNRYAWIRSIRSGSGGNDLALQVGGGNTGIATTTPDTVLNVVGSTQVFRVVSTGVSASAAGEVAGFVSPKGTPTLFMGSSDTFAQSEDTSGYSNSESAGNIRFNGSGVAWGDFGYYPTGGDAAENGHFRFSITGSSIDTTPDAKVGVGSLFSNGAIGIANNDPQTYLHIGDNTADTEAIILLGEVVEASESFLPRIHQTSAIVPGTSQDLALGTGSSNGGVLIYTGVPSSEYGRLGTGSSAVRLAVDVNGNVGVGTTTPTDLLHVYTSASDQTADTSADDLVVEGSGTHGMSILTGTGGNGTIFFGDSGNATIGRIQYQHSNDSMSLYTSNTAQIHIDSAGDVGIGTTSPTYNLTVYDSGEVRQLIGSSDGGGVSLLLDGNADGDATGGDYGVIQHDGTTGDLEIYNLHSGGDLALGTGSGADDLFINSSGYVNIGTSTAAEAFAVRLRSTDADGVVVYGRSSDDVSSIALRSYDGGTNTGFMQAGPSNGLQWGTIGGASMTLSTGGNLGIGTSTPGADLAIHSQLNGSGLGLYVDTRTRTGGEDYIWFGGATTPDFLVNTSGEIAMGTSSPVSGSKLSIVGSAYGAYIVAGNEAATVGRFEATGPTFTGTVIETDTVRAADVAYDLMNLKSAGTSRFLVGGTGNVGIGTTTPEAKFTIAGDSDAVMIISAAEGTTGNPSIRMKADRAAQDSQVASIFFENNNPVTPGASIRVYRGNVDSEGKFAINTSGTERFRIDEDGNVGIGTTAPGERFEVDPDSDIVTRLGRAHIGYAGTGSWGDNTLFAHVDHASSTSYSFAAMSGGSTRINGTAITFYEGGSTRIMDINNGDVGIGTTTAWRDFSVTGTVAFDGLTSSGTGNAVCITADNDITDAGGGTCTPSSERFKENIVALNDGLALGYINAMRVVSFDYKDGYYNAEDGKESIGLIAEEVELIDKRLVDYELDGTTPRTLQFERLTGLTIQAIQDISSNFDATAATGLATIKSSYAGTSTPLMTITTEGYIGIGTTTPEHPIVLGSGAHVTAGGTWVNASSKALKENFEAVDKQEVLEKITNLPVMEWNYILDEDEVRHIGPFAEDFYDAFQLGNSSGSISSIDPAGIALLGIQALNERIDDLSANGNTSDTQSNPVLSVLANLGVTIEDQIAYFVKLVADKTVTKELCVGETCINENQLASLLAQNNVIPNELNDDSIDFDSTPPVLTILGNNPLALPLEGTYNEPGVLVTDNEDEEIEYVVTGSINTSVLGEYELVYTATDSHNNTATTSRTIIIYNPDTEDGDDTNEEESVEEIVEEVIEEETPVEEVVEEEVVEEPVEEEVVEETEEVAEVVEEEVEEIVEEVIEEETPVEEVVEEEVVEEPVEEEVVEEVTEEEEVITNE